MYIKLLDVLRLGSKGLRGARGAPRGAFNDNADTHETRLCYEDHDCACRSLLGVLLWIRCRSSDAWCLPCALTHKQSVRTSILSWLSGLPIADSLRRT